MNPNYNPNLHDTPVVAVGHVIPPYDAASAPPPPPHVPVDHGMYGVAPPAPLTKLPSVQNDGNLREFLQNNDWSNAMQDYLITNLERIPLRFFICDDSGSMGINDGEKISTYGTQKKMTPCTRWAELVDALKFHANMAFAGKVASEFRFLNAAAPLKIGFDLSETRQNLDTFLRICDGSPNGGTPLCRHIREITAEIQRLEPALRASGQVACVVIATDGESSDGNVSDALRPLKSLPVMIVLRLCTNEDNIVTYWNKIDDELELNMDVLDDLKGEAKEVTEVNPWLTYGEPLHRMREFGVSMKEMDLLDEQLLSIDNFKRICKLFYGTVVDSFAPVEMDLKQFCTQLEKHQINCKKVWSPVKQAYKHWIDLQGVKKCYGKAGGCAIM